MVDNHRIKVLNSGETTRLERVTERIDKERQNLAKELRDIQNARLLFEAKKRSKKELKRTLSVPVVRRQSLENLQNSVGMDIWTNNSHQRSASRLFSNSAQSTPHSDLIRSKSEEAPIQQQARRMSLTNTPHRWSLSNQAPNQESLDCVPSNQRMRRISLPTVTPQLTCRTSSKWSKKDVLDDTSSRHMSESLSNLLPSKWSLSGSEKDIKMPPRRSRDKQPRSPQSDGRNKNWNLREDYTEVNSRGTFRCPLGEEKNDFGSNDLSVVFVDEYDRGQKQSSKETKLTLPLIVSSRSPSPLSQPDIHGRLSGTDMFKERRKRSLSGQILIPQINQVDLRRDHGSRDEYGSSGKQETGVRVSKPAERRASIKRVKALASVEIERLTRSSDELDEAMMSRFKRIGVSGMGHMVLKSAKVEEHMGTPGLLNTYGTKGTTVASSPLNDLAVTDLSDAPTDQDGQL